MIKIIAAMGFDRSMGVRGEAKLPWVSEVAKGDLARFKKLTTDSVIIMGRRTWESIGGKPLEGRVNIVISKKAFNGSTQADSIKDALSKAGTENVFLIGGEQIFKQGQRFATEIDLTLVPFKGYEHFDKDNLIYFPAINTKIFKKRSSFTHPNNPELRILKYRR